MEDEEYDAWDLPIGAQRSYYAIFFPNVEAGVSPFSEPIQVLAPVKEGHTPTDSKRLTKSQAGRILKRLFRISKPPKKETNPAAQMSAYVNELLMNNLKETAAGREQIDGTEFAAFCVKMMIWLLENVLMLKVKVVRSYDNRNLICLLGASDQSYGRMANFQQHRLRFSVKMPKENYGGVNPSTLLYRVQNPMDELISYSEANSDTTTEQSKTIFSQLSKLTLLTTHLQRIAYLESWVNFGLVIDHLCLHDSVALNSLIEIWTLKSMHESRTVREVRRYFGEQIALYFVWLDFFFRWMLIPSALGACLRFVSLSGFSSDDVEDVLLIGFAVLMSVWAMLLQKFWIRRERDLSWRWATYANRLKANDVRDDGSRKKKFDGVTGTMRNPRNDSVQIYKLFVSYSIIFVLDLAIIAAVVFIFSHQADFQLTPETVILWGCVIGAQIYVSNAVFSKVAERLTEWEDYGTNPEHFEALSAKLFFFRMVNSYASLLYIAFVKRYREGCMDDNCFIEMNWQLIALFAMQVLFKILECLVLYIRHVFTTRRMNSEWAKSFLPCEKQMLLTDGNISPFEMLDVFINYGYVLMFASTFPLLALTVLLLIVYQYKLDLVRFTSMYRRPIPKAAFSLGIGNTLFDLLSTLGAIVNPALMIFSTKYFSELTFEEQLFLFVAVEHGLFIIKLVLEAAIKDESEEVHTGIKWCELVEREQYSLTRREDRKLSGNDPEAGFGDAYELAEPEVSTEKDF